jgi:hypothetical protein
MGEPKINSGRFGQNRPAFYIYFVTRVMPETKKIGFLIIFKVKNTKYI